MSALDEFLRTGEICRRKVRGITTIADDGFDLFFSRFLDFCREQSYSKSWLDNTISGLRIFLLATHVSHTSTPEGIDMDTINCFSEAMRSADEICMNVRRMRCRQVAVYLHWLYQHGITKQDYSLQLPEFKRTPAKLPQTWSKEEIEQILAAIDTENPTGKRNYAMFLLMARTGLRISDVVSLRFSNIDWKNSTISLSQQKTGNNLGLPLSKELGKRQMCIRDRPLFHISKMDVPSHRRTSFSFVTLLHMTLWITTTTLIQSFGSICAEQELPCRKKDMRVFIRFDIRLPQICLRMKHRFRTYLKYWDTATST